MSYPSGGSGYNAPAPTPSSAPSFASQPSSGTGGAAGTTGSNAAGLPFYLTAGVTALGVINFLLGFTSYITQNSQDVGMGVRTPEVTRSFFAAPGGVAPLGLLLAGGLLAGVSLLPKQNWMGAAVAASAAGFLSVLFVSFTMPDGYSAAWGTWVVLFLGLVQTAGAVAAVLFESGIVAVPEPKPAAPPQLGYGPPSGYGQEPYGRGQPAPSPYSQPGQSVPAQPNTGQQPAAYGQYGQQPSYGQGQGAPSPYGQYPQYGQQGQAQYGQPGYGQYGAQPGYGAQQQRPQQPAPGGSDPADAGATQQFGGAGQQYGGVPSFGQQAGQPAASSSTPAAPGATPNPAGPFGEERNSNPAADATRAFRPGEDEK
jgi:hypothetical protein